MRKGARFHDDRLATEAYWLTQPAKLDPAALLGELKRGAAIPDVELSNPKSALMVRTKVMTFTDTQVRLLKAKLDPRYVRTRNSGSMLSYVEGWHAIAEANRISARFSKRSSQHPSSGSCRG